MGGGLCHSIVTRLLLIDTQSGTGVQPQTASWEIDILAHLNTN